LSQAACDRNECSQTTQRQNAALPEHDCQWHSQDTALKQHWDCNGQHSTIQGMAAQCARRNPCCRLGLAAQCARHSPRCNSIDKLSGAVRSPQPVSRREVHNETGRGAEAFNKLYKHARLSKRCTCLDRSDGALRAPHLHIPAKIIYWRRSALAPHSKAGRGQ